MFSKENEAAGAFKSLLMLMAMNTYRFFFFVIFFFLLIQ